MRSRTSLFLAAAALSAAMVPGASSAQPLSDCLFEEPQEPIICYDVHVSEGGVSVLMRIDDTKYRLERDPEGNVTFCRRESGGEEECLP